MEKKNSPPRNETEGIDSRPIGEIDNEFDLVLAEHLSHGGQEFDKRGFIVDSSKQVLAYLDHKTESIVRQNIFSILEHADRRSSDEPIYEWCIALALYAGLNRFKIVFYPNSDNPKIIKIYDMKTIDDKGRGVLVAFTNHPLTLEIYATIKNCGFNPLRIDDVKKFFIEFRNRLQHQ